MKIIKRIGEGERFDAALIGWKIQRGWDATWAAVLTISLFVVLFKVTLKKTPCIEFDVAIILFPFLYGRNTKN